MRGSSSDRWLYLRFTLRCFFAAPALARRPAQPACASQPSQQASKPSKQQQQRYSGNPAMLFVYSREKRGGTLIKLGTLAPSIISIWLVLFFSVSVTGHFFCILITLPSYKNVVLQLSTADFIRHSLKEKKEERNWIYNAGMIFLMMNTSQPCSYVLPYIADLKTSNPYE